MTVSAAESAAALLQQQEDHFIFFSSSLKMGAIDCSFKLVRVHNSVMSPLPSSSGRGQDSKPLKKGVGNIESSLKGNDVARNTGKLPLGVRLSPQKTLQHVVGLNALSHDSQKRVSFVQQKLWSRERAVLIVSRYKGTCPNSFFSRIWFLKKIAGSDLVRKPWQRYREVPFQKTDNV
jgi:hypothetical protein